MGSEHEARACAERFADSGQCGPDPGVVGDPPILQRHVEVDAHEDAPARQWHLGHRQNVHAYPGSAALRVGAATPASTAAVSSMRFENPHSLSYHAHTLTRRPLTFVSVAS